MERQLGSGYLSRPRPSGLADVIEILLDKGVVIDAYARVSLVGIELLTIDARLVISSVDTYLRFAEATNRLDLSDQGRSPVEMFTAGAGAVVEKVASDVVEDKVEGALDAVGDGLGEPVEKVAPAAAGKVMAVAEDLTTRATSRSRGSTAVRRQDETFEKPRML